MIGRWIVALVAIAMQFTIAEAQFTGHQDREAPGLVTHKFRVPAATKGFNTGLPLAIAFLDGHDFVPGDVVDLHWNSGPIVFGRPHHVARGFTVKNVLPQLIDFELLPAPEIPEGTPPELEDVFVSRQVNVATAVDPTTMTLLSASAGRQSVLDFRDDGDSSLLIEKFAKRNNSLFWTLPFGDNPLLGGTDLATIVASSGSDRFVDFFVIIQYDSILP